MKGFMFKGSLVILVMCILAMLVIAPATAIAKSVTYSRPKPHIAEFSEVCPEVGWLRARCLAIRTDFASPVPNVPLGYSPSDLRSAYRLSATTGMGQTVAIVDAFDDPKAESDLQVYRSRFGLPACATANGCFKKVNQRGGRTYPSADPNWAQEISLDLDMVSAICPNCHILLVEADDNSFDNLGRAASEAAILNANVISNSYGGSEFDGEMSFAQFYNHPGHVYVASSGDSGYRGGVAIPAAFNTVTAVGGTTLERADNARGWEEAAWSDTGSGCSDFVPKPRWQRDDECENRMLNDVSAVADPSTGVSVYDSYREPGWLVFGGTSVSAPVIAGVYALSGNANRVIYGSYPYSHATALYDITTGTNDDCEVSYFCTAGVGYDGPTGLGTPKGTGAF